MKIRSKKISPSIFATANVTNASITIHPSDWTYDNLYKQWRCNCSSSASNESAVLGYIIFGNGKQVLPYEDNVFNCQYTMATNLFQTSPFIQFQFTNVASLTTRPANDQYFYLTIIPPGMRKPNVNYDNYNEVRNAHNLND